MVSAYITTPFHCKPGSSVPISPPPRPPGAVWTDDRLTEEA